MVNSHPQLPDFSFGVHLIGKMPGSEPGHWWFESITPSVIIFCILAILAIFALHFFHGAGWFLTIESVVAILFILGMYLWFNKARKSQR